jgi:GT2 family glycosyltransferase/glycosyltransferase involved in cell wall biosynthesis
VGHGYRIRYALPSTFPKLPLVSLIIPTRNGLDLLRQCIDSIQQKTAYRPFEIIVVDNGSDDPATLDYLQLIAVEANVQILRIDAPFNYSALNNAAVKVAKGELVGLVNNDIEVISSDWLGELVSHAMRPGVGAVGARLWFPDNTLQHGGVVLGIHSWAAHAHNHFPRGSLGYKGRMALVQNFSAVTGACLLVRKSAFEAVGGLNEDALKISCNDVDFCLKLQKIGLRNVWTPFADLYHHESATRGFEDTPAKKARFAGELAYMQRHWAAELHNDPAYSPNLTLNAQDFGLAWPPRVAWSAALPPATPPQPGMPPLYERLSTLAKGRHRVAYFAENVHSSTFRYRAANMAEVLNAPLTDGSTGDLPTSAACFFSDDLEHAAQMANNADILVISRARYDAGLADLVRQFKAQGKKVWFDIDDLVFDTREIDLIVETQGQPETEDVLDYWYSVVGRMAQALRLCDGALTTNAYLAGKLRAFADMPVNVIPNFINQAQLAASEPLYLRKKTAGFASFASDERITLGYFSGSASHNRDFALIVPALEAVMAADPRVDLLIVGHMDLAVACGPHGILPRHFADRITQHGFTDYLTLQQLIASVDFNLMPLQSNDFTNCKSELKYFDAAAVGTLSIASPTYAYNHAIRHGENGYLAADSDWEAVLRQAIAQRANYAAMAQAAYQGVQNRFVWHQQRGTLVKALM